MEASDNNLVVVKNDSKPVSVFQSIKFFEDAQRMGKMLAQSKLIPVQFQNNLADVVIALEMANRMHASPVAVMQNLYIVHGKPSWSATFIIGAINATGRFSPLRFRLTGEGDARTCIAQAKDLRDGELLESSPVSIGMAKKEGWYSKNGSKWQSMPELMLRYRAATIFGRLYASDLLMGMRSDDELRDLENNGDIRTIDGSKEASDGTSIDVLNAAIGAVDDVAAEKDGDNNKLAGKDTDVDQGKIEKKPAAVKAFKSAIDRLTEPLDIDTWRMKHEEKIIKSLQNVDYQNEVFAYAEDRYQWAKSQVPKNT
jgi:hypothetical protein